MTADTTTKGDLGVDAPPGMYTEALRREASRRPATLRVETFRDPASGTPTELVYDDVSRIGVVIDPRAAGSGADPAAPSRALIDAIERLAIDLQYSLETRHEEGHRSASQWLARRYGTLVVRGSGDAPAEAWAPHPAAGSAVVDIVAEDGEELVAGPLRIGVVATGRETRYRIAGSSFPQADAPQQRGRGLAGRWSKPTLVGAPDPAEAA